MCLSTHTLLPPNKHFTRRRQWHPTPVLLPGKSHGQRSLVGCSPWGREESDTTERLDFHFSLSCIGEGNGTPLQCSCLENPRDGEAWWAAVYGVAQSWTRLKRRSSSSICKYRDNWNKQTGMLALIIRFGFLRGRWELGWNDDTAVGFFFCSAWVFYDEIVLCVV